MSQGQACNTPTLRPLRDEACHLVGKTNARLVGIPRDEKAETNLPIRITYEWVRGGRVA